MHGLPQESAGHLTCRECVTVLLLSEFPVLILCCGMYGGHRLQPNSFCSDAARVGGPQRCGRAPALLVLCLPAVSSVHKLMVAPDAVHL